MINLKIFSVYDQYQQINNEIIQEYFFNKIDEYQTEILNNQTICIQKMKNEISYFDD